MFSEDFFHYNSVWECLASSDEMKYKEGDY